MTFTIFGRSSDVLLLDYFRAESGTPRILEETIVYERNTEGQRTALFARNLS